MAEINALFEPWYLARDRAEIARTLKAAPVPAAAGPRPGRGDGGRPHAAARHAARRGAPDPGQLTPPASPLGFHGAAAPELKLLPALGEHTGEVLGE